jgi:hypothetical protein
MIGAKFEEMREAYLTYRTLRHQMEHPNVPHSKSRKYARVAWRQKVERWRERGLLHDSIHEDSKDQARRSSDNKNLHR